MTDFNKAPGEDKEGEVSPNGQEVKKTATAEEMEAKFNIADKTAVKQILDKYKNANMAHRDLRELSKEAEGLSENAQRQLGAEVAKRILEEVSSMHATPFNNLLGYGPEHYAKKEGFAFRLAVAEAWDEAYAKEYNGTEYENGHQSSAQKMHEALWGGAR